MRRVVALTLLAGGLLGTGVPAQAPSYVFSLFSDLPSQAGIFFSPSQGGTFQRIVPAGVSLVQKFATLPGRRHILVAESENILQNPLPLSVLDVDTRAYTPIGSLVQPSGYFPNFLVDQEGDVIFIGGTLAGGGLYRALGDFSLSSMTILPPPNGPIAVVVDIDTGDYVANTDGGIFRVRPHGAVSTVASGSYLLRELRAQDPETGEFLLWYGNQLLKVSPQGVISTAAITGATPRTLAVDDTPTPWGEYVFASTTRFGTNYLARVSRWGGPVNTLLTFPASIPIDLMLVAARNLSTARAGVANRWNLFIDFPYDSGYPYVVLVGISGIRPWVQLTDGRKIRLNPDWVTVTGLAGILPGFSGLAGTIDARGMARGLIDLSGLGPLARGTPFWMLGLVLDPQAPSGIRRVSPPIVVQVR